MEDIRIDAKKYTYIENIYKKKGYSKSVSLRLLAEDKRVKLCYQQVKQNGRIQQGSSKVMIVGDHGVGKTSLCKHLMELPFKKDEMSTKSVEMYDVETVKVDKNWKRIPNDCKEYERVLNACAAYEFQKISELEKQKIQVQNGIELNSTRQTRVYEKQPDASQNDNVTNVENNTMQGCHRGKGYDDSKFKSVSAVTVMKMVSVSIPALFVYGGFPSSFAVLHIIYVAMLCFLYKEVSFSQGYRIGQACAIVYFFIQNVTVYWGIVQSEHNFNCFEGLMALFVMSAYGFACGMLIGSGCRHGLELACALVFSPTNHMYLTSLPDMWHMFSTQHLIQFLTISIGAVVGGAMYHLKEYNFCIVKVTTIISSIGFVTLYYSENISDKSYVQLEMLRHFTIIHHSMIFVRILCGIVFVAFFFTGLINYGRKIVTYTDINHCTRVALGLLFGILLAKFAGAYFSTFSYNQLVDITFAILPTIIFEIHGFLQVYKQDLDMNEFCRSLKRLERQEEIVPLHIHLVDFAGDKEYHTSHQAFLAKGATYIVVFNLENSICSKEMVLDRIKYWLNSILMYVGTGQYVFLVGTHKDKVKETDVRYFQKWLSTKISETSYNKHFCFIFPKAGSKQEIFFAVKNPEKFSKDTEACLLRKKISQLARSPITTNSSNVKATGQYTEPVPLSWFHLLDVTRCLCLSGTNFISKKEFFRKLVEQNDLLTEEEFVKMLKYFSNRGDITYYDSYDALKDVVVLHSQLFRDTIAVLVSKSVELQSDTKLQSKGIVTSDALCAALQTDNIEEKQVLRNLLEANDLILPLRSCDGETDYMLSGFLPEYNESEDTPHMRVTGNVYYFDFYSFLPEKLFLKLIVKCKENSQETDEHRDPTYKPMIYRNAASFIQQCGENEIPYNIRTVQKSTSQNLIQICIGTVSDNHRYYMLENLNSWVRDIVKQYDHEPRYHLGFPCAFNRGCLHEEGQNHIHLYRIAEKNGFKTGKQVTLVCPCTREMVQLDILPFQPEESTQCLRSSPLNSQSMIPPSFSVTRKSLSRQGLTSMATLIRDMPEGLVQIISNMLNIHLGRRDWTGLAAELGLSHNEVEMYRMKSNSCRELLRYWGSCTRDNIQNFLDIMRKLERLDVYDEVLAWITQQTPGEDSMNN